MAIGLVLLFHYVACYLPPAAQPPGSYVQALLRLTWSGVDLFFVLSGFLVGGIILDHRKSPNLVRAFFTRRFFRIVPLYIVSLVGYVAFAAWLGSRDPGGLFAEPLPAWTYLTYTQNFLMAGRGEFGPHWLGLTWSLAVEEQFYLIAPFLLRVIPARRLPVALALLVLSAPLVRTALYLSHPHGGFAGYVLLPARWDALFLGVFGAFLVRHPGTAAFLTVRRPYLIGAVAVLGLGLVVFAQRGISLFSWGMATVGHTWLALFYLSVVLLVAVHPTGTLARAMSNWGLVRLGVYSYGVYLFHMPVNILLHAWVYGSAPRVNDPQSLLLTGASAFITICLAALSYQLVEAPMQRFGRRESYSSKRTGTLTPSSHP